MNSQKTELSGIFNDTILKILLRHIYLAAYSGNIKEVHLTQTKRYEASVKS